MALPSNVQYGRVIGTFINAVADGSDADEFPDAEAPTGSITFTPRVTRIVNNDGVKPVTILPKPIRADLKDGSLVDSQQRPGITLVANKGTTGQNPAEWQYDVQYQINGATLPTFPLSIEPGETVDLSVVAPLPADPAIVQVVSDASRVAAEAAAERAELAAERAETAGIQEVNGKTGPEVTLSASDVNALPNQYSSPDGNQRLPYYLANTGQFGYVIMDVNAGNGTVVKRQASGHVLVPSEPTFGTHATSKTYVDDQISALELPPVVAAGSSVQEAREAIKIFVLAAGEPLGTDPEAIYIRPAA